MTSDVTHLWACDKTIFRIGILLQKKNTNEKTQILIEILHFSWQEQIQKIKLFKYYTEKGKNKCAQNCHHKDRNLPLRIKDARYIKKPC